MNHDSAFGFIICYLDRDERIKTFGLRTDCCNPNDLEWEN